MFSSPDFAVCHLFLHWSHWSIWTYFSVRGEGNLGLLMGRRVKWSEPSFRNAYLAAAYNLKGRGYRLKQKTLAAEIIHAGVVRAVGKAARTPQEVKIQVSASVVYGTFTLRDCRWAERVMSQKSSGRAVHHVLTWNFKTQSEILNPAKKCINHNNNNNETAEFFPTL